MINPISKIIFILFFSKVILAGEVHIAVASNFTAPMEKISSLFTSESGNKLMISYGATGKFYAQIKNNAPFDILISADQDYVKKLILDNFAISGTEFTYAIGKLVLWSSHEKLIDPKGEVLASKEFKHIGLANPKLAPYGMAAQQTLEKKDLWNKLQSKLVFGENISQTFQFVQTGNAELGFIAFSQIKNDSGKIKGSYWLVPSDYYSPIKQDVVLLKKGSNNEAAKSFLMFLKSKTAKKIILDYGYDLQN